MWKEHIKRTNLRIVTSIFLSVIIGACATSAPMSLDDQAIDINKSLMCPVCPSETIDQSQVPLAKDMRLLVRAKLEQGWNKSEILDFFAARYGPKVLADPPKSGTNLILWATPPIGLLLGIIMLIIILKSMKAFKNREFHFTPVDSDLDPYLTMVDQDIQITPTNLADKESIKNETTKPGPDSSAHKDDDERG